ncbi:heme-binding protein [Novosphingobium sp. AP12]|uniref:GlcG/HbpS family heme-binding protein n=1 Tax=Novosphingobium sp. AP12 TaxID=1144305 RepID=UPI00027219FC|nr:heme-binding protein [Novosphingobium sp. AP12]EJL27974.1 hypothetical protein, possibly involved in utilization of glycolate and propanediol [Novosphingobium sp. AP12]
MTERRFRIGIVASLCVALAAPGQAQQTPRYGDPIGLAHARTVVRLAEEEARARGLRMAIAVASPSGEPVALEVMDGTQNASITIAPAKARTAARFRKPTKLLQDAVAAGNLAYAVADGALALEGGLPITVGGRIVGALGVSGGTSVQDGEVAAAALRRFDQSAPDP